MAISNESGVSIGVKSPAGAVGAQVYQAATTAAAQNALGGGTVGKQLFATNTTAAAQNILGTGLTEATTAQATAGAVAGVAMSPVLVRNFVDSYSGTAGLQVFQAATTAAAQNALGGTAIGKAIFGAASTAAAQDLLEAGTVGLQVFKTATTAAAQNALGGTAVGKGLFEAATTAAAQTLLELNFAVGSIVVGGQGGGKLEASGVKVSGSNISQYGGVLQSAKTDSYTLVSSDTGTIIPFNVASAAVLTCPKTMPVGFIVEVLQLGTAQVTFTAGTSAAVTNRSSHTKTAGQYAAARLLVTTNSDGSNAQYNLAGDTGA